MVQATLCYGYVYHLTIMRWMGWLLDFKTRRKLRCKQIQMTIQFNSYKNELKVNVAVHLENHTHRWNHIHFTESDREPTFDCTISSLVSIHTSDV